MIYLSIDPAQIDINIHPTKTEIKFQDERAIYAIVHAAVRRALGKFNISPSLDFEQETSIEIPPVRAGQEINPPHVHVDQNFNPFGNETVQKDRGSALKGWFDQKEKQANGWEELYKIYDNKDNGTSPVTEIETPVETEQLMAPFEWTDEAPLFQLHRKYIGIVTPKGLMLVDQQRAHQRLLYEKFMHQMDLGKGPSQQLLFPINVTLNHGDFALLVSGMDELSSLGFDLIQGDDHSIEILGVPADAGVRDGQKLLEEFLEQWKNERGILQYTAREKMAWALASASSIRYGQMLTSPEMNALTHDLFQCSMPYSARDNKPTIIQLTMSQLEQQFK
jgi:DNA mismatch repair protein MutL